MSVKSSSKSNFYRIQILATILLNNCTSHSRYFSEIDTIVRPQMKSREHTFEIIVRGIQHEDVVVDKLRLNQVLLNLLSNTMKYTPEGGHVMLTLEELKQHSRQYAHYRISVVDNGVGMSPEYVDKVFDVFSRESDSTTSRIQGTGLGMAITKKLVDLMGGNITVQSELNRGTTFTVELELRICEKDIDEQFWKKNGIFRTQHGTDNSDRGYDGNAYAEDIRHSLEAGMDAHVSKPIDMEVLEETVRDILKNREQSDEL